MITGGELRVRRRRPDDIHCTGGQVNWGEQAGPHTCCRRRTPAPPPRRSAQHAAQTSVAGRPITLRLEDTLAHVVIDGVLARTIPLTLSPAQRAPASKAPALRSHSARHG